MSPAEKRNEVRVLLIEDERDFSFIFEKSLQGCQPPGCHLALQCVNCLGKALEALRENRFDVIFADLGLPDSQGLETFIKVREAAPNIPVVICSAISDRDMAIESIRLGAQDFMIKDEWDRKMLERVLIYALERQRVLTLKEEFIAMVVHDLRNPITVIMQVVDQLEKGYCGELTPQQKSFLKLGGRSLEKLHHMIDELFEMSKIELGRSRLEKTRFNLCEMVRETAENLRVLANKKGILLKLELPAKDIFIDADQEKIGNVWVNLGNNAFKFTQEGSVTFRVKEDGNCVQCSVQDTGCGIPKEKQEQLFKKFERLGAKQKGTGLGLVIAKSTIQAHGGKIWVESVPDKGSAFHFILPLVERRQS